MTTEERIAELERQLAEKDRLLALQAQALADAMAAVRASADDRKALEARRSADRERKAAQYRRRLSRDLQASVSRETHVSGLPPPLEGSPPPSVPSSPSPISSPPSFSPPASQASRTELRLEPQEAARRTRAKKPKPEKPTDPRHRLLLEHLVAQGWELGGARGARAVTDLLSRAGETVPREEAPAEVLRRAGHALQKRKVAPSAFPAVAELWELVTHWQHFAETFRAQPAKGPAPPSDFETPTPYTPPAWATDPDWGMDPNAAKE